MPELTNTTIPHYQRLFWRVSLATIFLLVVIDPPVFALNGNSNGSAEVFSKDQLLIEEAAKEPNGAGLATAMSTVEKHWLPQDSDQYYRLVLKLCACVSKVRPERQGQYLYLERYLVDALSETPPPIELSDDCFVYADLLSYVVRDQAYWGHALSQADWSVLRNRKLCLMLAALDRVSALFDPSVDVSKPVPADAVPPMERTNIGWIRLPSGVDPSAISDPVARAKYAERLRAIKANIVKINRQIELHQEYDAIAFFALHYAGAAYGSETPSDMDGLSRALVSYHIESVLSEKMLAKASQGIAGR